MHQEYPKLLYGPAGRTRLVGDAEAEDIAAGQGFSTAPGEAHRISHRSTEPTPHASEPLTEAHIPLIVEQVAETVFERLKGMALAAASDPAHREAADGVAALHEGLDARFAALRAELLDGVAALIAPAPAPERPSAGKRG